MQISSVQAGHQNQNVLLKSSVEGTASEEANETSAQKNAEAQKKAIAQTTGIGINLDMKA